jgi:hypothetical protein
MMPLEEAIVDTLQRRGPCCLQDVHMSLPNVSWGEVFLAVDRMSRHGRVSLLQLGSSTYQITLRAQFGQLAPATNQKGAQSSLVL